ncbi:hypothetical protein DPEC_G00073640 [Dallia pectoralis]|uniref:Uncharacterized protein n=1 Tax=Dallia pectoralis TaxID=75939 RepID=A0ACC2H2P2_DALPE|nr:hypothetical protein DPEC_G00073640 [Dallia pectoralis]
MATSQIMLSSLNRALLLTQSPMTTVWFGMRAAFVQYRTQRSEAASLHPANVNTPAACRRRGGRIVRKEASSLGSVCRRRMASETSPLVNAEHSPVMEDRLGRGPNGTRC